MSVGFVVVADEVEMDSDGMKEVFVHGHPVLLCRVGGRLYACSAECTHEDGADLVDGSLDGFHLKCPEHGCLFDVRSGRVLGPPAEEPLATYELKVDGGHIWVATRPRGF